MPLVQILPPLAAVAGLCAGLTVFAGLPAGAAPLAAFALAALLLTAGGLVGVLVPAAWLLLAAGLALGAAAVLRWYRGGLQFSRSLGGWVFWLGAAVLAVRFALLQPQLVNYDEYSFWGTATRLTCLNGKLYTECAIGTPWQITQTPAVPQLGNIVQLCGPRPYLGIKGQNHSANQHSTACKQHSAHLGIRKACKHKKIQRKTQIKKA